MVLQLLRGWLVDLRRPSRGLHVLRVFGSMLLNRGLVHVLGVLGDLLSNVLELLSLLLLNAWWLPNIAGQHLDLVSANPIGHQDVVNLGSYGICACGRCHRDYRLAPCRRKSAVGASPGLLTLIRAT